MTKRVHLVTGERPESAKAYAAFIAYTDMPNHSISKLHHHFLEQAAAYKQQQVQNGGDGPLKPPPTTSKKMLLEWSAAFDWTQRVRDWQLECDLARRQEYLRQIEAQARQ